MDKLTQFMCESWSLFAAAVLFTLVRLLARVRLLGFKGLQGDDYLALIALLSFSGELGIAHIGGSMFYKAKAAGQLLAQTGTALPNPAGSKTRELALKLHFALSFLYTTTLWLLKASLLTLYLRLTREFSGRYRSRVFAGFGFLAVSWVAIILTIFLGCRPFHQYFDPDPNKSSKLPGPPQASRADWIVCLTQESSFLPTWRVTGHTVHLLCPECPDRCMADLDPAAHGLQVGDAAVEKDGTGAALQPRCRGGRVCDHPLCPHRHSTQRRRGRRQQVGHPRDVCSHHHGKLPHGLQPHQGRSRSRVQVHTEPGQPQGGRAAPPSSEAVRRGRDDWGHWEVSEVPSSRGSDEAVCLLRTGERGGGGKRDVGLSGDGCRSWVVRDGIATQSGLPGVRCRSQKSWWVGRRNNTSVIPVLRAQQ